MRHFIGFIAPFITTLILLVVPAGCDRETRLSGQLDVADSLLVSRPDSAFVILDSIRPDDISGKKTRARYALLKSMALDKNCLDTTTFDILQPAIDYYLRKGSPDERLKTYYYQGRIYQNREENDSAMQCYIHAGEYAQEATDTLAVANLLVAQGTILYSIYKTEDFIDVNLQAARLYDRIGRTDYEVSSLVNALDGSILTGREELADSILSVAHERAAGNEELISEIAPYILSYAVSFGDREDVDAILAQYAPDDSIGDATRLDVAEAYSRIGNQREAKRYLDALPPDSKARSSLKFLALRPDILKGTGDPEGALEAFRDYSATLDSIHRDIFSHDLLFARERHEMEKRNLQELGRRDRIIWLCVSAFLLLLSATILIYHRYRLRKAKSFIDEQERKRLLQEKQTLLLEQEKMALKQEKMALERETLALENRRLDDERQTLVELLEKEKGLSSPIEESVRHRLELLNGLLAKEITDNEAHARPFGEWLAELTRDKEEFMNANRIAFRASNPGFIRYLEERGLSVAETNYVCLYALGLKGKEVGAYIHLKRHYQISSAVRKKLGIDEHQANLGIYIRKLLKDF